MKKFLFEFTENELRLLCASTNILACLTASKNKDEAQALDALHQKLQKVYEPYLRACFKVISNELKNVHLSD